MRFSHTVSTVRKSHATVLEACWARNCRSAGSGGLPEDGCRIEPTPSGPAPGAKYTSEISIGPPSFNRRNEDDYETWSQGKSRKRTLHAHKHDLTGPPDSAAAFPSTG